MWIWQQADWPGLGKNTGNEFRYDQSVIAPRLRHLHFMMGIVVGRMDYLEGESTAFDTLLAKIVSASEVVGRGVDQDSLRSALRGHLNVCSKSHSTDPMSEGQALAYLDVQHNLDCGLTIDKLSQWNIWLCADRPSMLSRNLGGKRRFDEHRLHVHIKVPSMPADHELKLRVPPASQLACELNTFIDWFNNSVDDQSLDPFIRAGIAHLWFLVLQPFHSENIRTALLLTELALAQAQPKSIRFYAVSTAIAKDLMSYYKVIEQSLQGTTDITYWLIGFLDLLESALDRVLEDVELLQRRVFFWRSNDKALLSIEQVQFIDSLIDGNFPEGISAKEYAEFQSVSFATATRHLTHFLKIGCLVRSESGGRSTRYFIRQA
jgi:Fic family protein